jgi:hypothetical protein
MRFRDELRTIALRGLQSLIPFTHSSVTADFCLWTCADQFAVCAGLAVLLMACGNIGQLPISC